MEGTCSTSDGTSLASHKHVKRSFRHMSSCMIAELHQKCSKRVQNINSRTETHQNINPALQCGVRAHAARAGTHPGQGRERSKVSRPKPQGSQSDASCGVRGNSETRAKRNHNACKTLPGTWRASRGCGAADRTKLSRRRTATSASLIVSKLCQKCHKCLQNVGELSYRDSNSGSCMYTTRIMARSQSAES